MSEAAGRKVIQVGGVDVIVKELTVAEVRSLLNQDIADPDLIGDFIMGDVRFSDLVRMTSLNGEQLENMLPSQIQEVLDTCKSVNRHFFALTARLSKAQAKP